MKFRTLPIAAILFIATAMVVQFVISFSLEKEHVREVVEYRMQLAQKDFFYVLLGFHNAADEMRYKEDKVHWRVYSQTMYPINMKLMIAVPNRIIWQSIRNRSIITLCVLIIGMVVNSIPWVMPHFCRSGSMTTESQSTLSGTYIRLWEGAHSGLKNA